RTQPRHSGKDRTPAGHSPVPGSLSSAKVTRPAGSVRGERQKARGSRGEVVPDDKPRRHLLGARATRGFLTWRKPGMAFWAVRLRGPSPASARGVPTVASGRPRLRLGDAALHGRQGRLIRLVHRDAGGPSRLRRP